MSRIRSRWLAAVVAVLVASVAGAAAAWVPLRAGTRWATASLPVPYRMNEASAPASIGVAAARAAVVAGFATWSSQPCTSWRTVNAGTSTLTAARLGDGQNTIVFRAGTWPPELGSVTSTIGVTTPLYRFGGPITEADIQFNTVGFTWSLDGAGRTVDTQSIATHEQGHFLGLGHTPLTAAVMFAAYAGGIKRTLLGDDAMGVCSLYPTGTTTMCTTDTMCASGQRCIMGVCQWVVVDGGGTGRGVLGDPCSMAAPCSPPNSCACLSAMSCICSRVCSTSSPCPTGYRCVAVLGANLCLLAGTAILGAECANGLDCASGVCLPRAGGGFCSQTCATSCDCPADFECLDRAGTTYCMPGTNACTVDSGTPPEDTGVTDDTGTVDDIVSPAGDAGLVDARPDGGTVNNRPGCTCHVGAMERGRSAWTLGLICLAMAVGVRRRRRAR